MMKKRFSFCKPEQKPQKANHKSFPVDTWTHIKATTTPQLVDSGRLLPSGEYQWTHLWKNLHLQYTSFLIRRLLSQFFLHQGLHIHKCYIRKYHGGVSVFVKTYGLYRYPSFKLFSRKPRKDNRKRKIKDFYDENFASLYPLKKPAKGKTNLLLRRKEEDSKNLGKAILNVSQTAFVRLRFHTSYLPKTAIYSSIDKKTKSSFIFQIYKNQRFFWESLQVLSSLFKGHASASFVGSFIYLNVRRNPRRAAFLAFVKRLLDWHLTHVEVKRIHGCRIEVKGRFNAKSRTKKHILSVGRVKIQELPSLVDHASLEAFTKYGSLGIKVWVCPIEETYAFTATKN